MNTTTDELIDEIRRRLNSGDGIRVKKLDRTIKQMRARHTRRCEELVAASTARAGLQKQLADANEMNHRLINEQGGLLARVVAAKAELAAMGVVGDKVHDILDGWAGVNES